MPSKWNIAQKNKILVLLALHGYVASGKNM